MDSLDAVAAAVTPHGADGPDHVSVRRPVKGAVVTLFIALIMITIGVASITGLLACPAIWPTTEKVALARINGLSVTCWALCFQISVLVFAIASPWVGSLTASAGNNKIELGARKSD